MYADVRAEVCTCGDKTHMQSALMLVCRTPLCLCACCESADTVGRVAEERWTCAGRVPYELKCAPAGTKILQNVFIFVGKVAEERWTSAGRVPYKLKCAHAY